MTAAHNVLFTPISPSSPDFEGRGHVSNRSSGSITSDFTTRSSRPFGDSMSNAQLLVDHRRTAGPNTSAQHQPRYSSPLSERNLTHKCRSWTAQTWRHAALGLTAAVICWVVYCTIRYFIAVRIYSGDHVRSRYALGMGITSAFTIIFFAGESCMTARFFNIHFDRRFRTVVHSLALLSSTLVLCLTIINLVLVIVWRTPHDPSEFGRSIQGRCRWDFDVVWSGTGMACVEGADPFHGWLGAAIARLILSVVLILAYYLTLLRNGAFRETRQTSTAVGEAETAELFDCQPSIHTSVPPEVSPHTNDFNGDGCLPLPRSESPGTIPADEILGEAPQLESGGELAQVSPRNTYLRTITVPSNDLDELASTFQSFVLNLARETQAGMMLETTTRPPRPTVRVLGSDISRMSTIDSLGSREAGGAARSPTRSDTALSSASKNYNRDRDRDESLPTPSTAEGGPFEEQPPS